MTRKHYRTCNLCEAMCGLEIEIDGDAVTAIRGDERDAFSRGYFCIKGEALQDLHTSKDRLKKPLQRTKNGWRELAISSEPKDPFDRMVIAEPTCCNGELNNRVVWCALIR